MRELLHIESAGVVSSIQDHGRLGNRALAIPKSGSLDSYSMSLANYLVGNDLGAPSIEVIGGVFRAKVLRYCQLAVMGANTEVLQNDVRRSLGKPIDAKENDLITIKGALSYLAVAGAFSGRNHFESLSTYPLAKLGGLKGSYLKKGDFLEGDNTNAVHRVLPSDLLPKKSGIIRILKGPELEDGMESMVDTVWSVSTDSNRIGLRLNGGTLNTNHRGMPTVPVFPGTIQLPSGGQPILLLADSQTTGGYPRIGQIIQADLDRVGRLICGGEIRFKFVEIDEAREIFTRQQTFIDHVLQ